ncbi:transporter, major facilitator family protein [Ancylostoma caninum]|uniref:Transporter, major facilitator family protein n=1 Tax=Ancylostoma caninum TaxID=29170 RepID=A0A368GLL5_ANCCA|nr:transporter, major facilitator family protein [Ancylostoma caninum]
MADESAANLHVKDVNSTHERARLLKRADRPQRLRLPSTLYIPEPSPCTPCSVFSFDLPNSPAVVKGRPRFARSVSHGSAPTPRSIFSFETAFDFASPKTPRTPRTPISPRTPKTPRFPELPTIEESRNSFSFGVPAFKEETSTEENTSTIDSVTSRDTDWKSIRMIMVVILLTRIQFTVYFASLWPFLQEIDGNATMQDYAFISAAYSIGIAGSAPLFGYWSNKLGCIRIPSMTSMVLMLTTNFMYMFLHNFPGYGRYSMGVARFLAGIAAGGNSLLPTYWTYAAAAEDRSTAAALFDGAFCLGIALGPGFQLIFSPLSYPGSSVGLLQINMYTMPAIVANVLVGVSLIIMAFFFKEAPMFREGKRDSVVSTGTQFSISLPPFDKVAVFCCIFAKMVQMFIYANMETIGSMYTQQMFDLTRTETTQFNSVLVSLSGLIGFAFLLTYVWTKLGKRVDNRVGVLIGVLVCVAFLFSTYSWPFYPGNIESDACHSPWCATTPRIPWQLYAGSYVVVFGVGFAMMNVHLAAMYSGVLGPRRQGTMHGINTLLASCSRVLGPVAVTDMFWYFGPQVVWIFQFATWAVLLAALAVFHKRLVPLEIPQIQDEQEQVKDANQ